MTSIVSQKLCKSYKLYLVTLNSFLPDAYNVRLRRNFAGLRWEQWNMINTNASFVISIVKRRYYPPWPIVSNILDHRLIMPLTSLQ